MTFFKNDRSTDNRFGQQVRPQVRPLGKAPPNRGEVGCRKLGECKGEANVPRSQLGEYADNVRSTRRRMGLALRQRLLAPLLLLYLPVGGERVWWQKGSELYHVTPREGEREGTAESSTSIPMKVHGSTIPSPGVEKEGEGKVRVKGSRGRGRADIRPSENRAEISVVGTNVESPSVLGVEKGEQAYPL